MNFRTMHWSHRLACLPLLLGMSSALAADIGRLVVFGDGLSDTGNAYAESVAAGGAGTPPVPAYYDGRASNGPLWVEYLATGFGLSDPEPALAGGSNHARLGAGIGDLESQIDEYLAQGNAPGGDNLYVFWAGLDDFLDADGGALAVPDPSDLVAGLILRIESISDAADPDVNLRFLVANLPPLGQTARGRWLAENTRAEAPQVLDRLVVQVNSLLRKELKLLAWARDLTIVELDVHRLSREIQADPVAFGFVNAVDPARASDGSGTPPSIADATDMGTVVDPDGHVYYDDVYPTSRFHELLAERALDALTGAGL